MGNAMEVAICKRYNVARLLERHGYYYGFNCMGKSWASKK